MMSANTRLLTAAATLLLLGACTSGDTAKGGKDAVAATVNGTPISERQVEQILKQRGGGHEQPADPEARKALIDNLAMQLILAQESAKKGLDKTQEVTEQLELARQSVLANAFVQDYIKNGDVSEDVLKAEYEKIKTQMAGSEYKARHILVEKETEAKDIIAKLQKNPQAFAALAKEKSKDPGSKGNGGDLGWFDPRGMVPEFGAAVAKLAKGKFTDTPVKSQFGYHVILLEDARDKQFMPMEQIKPRLKQQVQQQNLKKLLDEMKAKAKIDIVEVAAPAATPAATPAAAPAAADAGKAGDAGKH